MLEGLACLAVIFGGFYAAMTAMNLAFFGAPPLLADVARPRISLLIPARDEAVHIDGALTAALASEAVDLEVVVLDDGSTDGTDAKVRAWAACDPRVRLIHGPALPRGWNGKQHACLQLSRSARHDKMVFVDADVRLRPDCLARLAAAIDGRGLDLASGFPRQRTETLSEALVIPQIHVLLLGYLPLPLARLFGRAPGLAAGCGQLMAVRRSAYEVTGGHAAIRATRHDGLMLPRLFRRSGYRTDLFDASDLAECRMYAGADEVWRGFAKNATEGMATPVALPVWTALLVGGHILPWVLVPATLLAGAADAAAVSLGAVVSGLLFRVVLAGRFRQPLSTVPLHPGAIALTLAIQWSALAASWQRQPAEWRGRAYRPDQS
jgi:Glycosyl transferase family 2